MQRTVSCRFLARAGLNGVKHLEGVGIMEVVVEKKPLYRRIFNNARHYSDGAAFLYENVFNGKKNAAYIAPGVLCATFCIELLLKCLVLIRHDDVFTKADVKRKNIELDKHKYSEIFEKIDPDIQEKIVQTFNDYFGESIAKQDYIELLKKLGDNSFVEWRYVYETDQEKHLDIKLQNKITDSLGKCIESVLKER